MQVNLVEKCSVICLSQWFTTLCLTTAATQYKVSLNNISSIWCQVADILCVHHLWKVQSVQQKCQDVKIVIQNKLFHCYCCHLVRIIPNIAEMTLTTLTMSLQVMSEVTLKQPIIIKLTNYVWYHYHSSVVYV